MDHLLDIVCKPTKDNDELSESEDDESSEGSYGDEVELADEQGDADSDSEDDQ